VPTESHLALNGIILRRTMRFWDDHYGPWGHSRLRVLRAADESDLVDEARAKTMTLDNRKMRT